MRKIDPQMKAKVMTLLTTTAASLPDADKALLLQVAILAKRGTEINDVEALAFEQRVDDLITVLN